MKNKITIFIVAFLCTAAVAYAVFSSLFPKAKPINAPTAEDTVSIALIRNDTTAHVEPAAFEDFLKIITNASATRIMSVNDYPTAKTYYIIEIHTTAHTYRYFTYEENFQVYIEIPYEGVYKSNRQLLDLISAYF